MHEQIITGLGDPDVEALQIGIENGPTYIELRARGAVRSDEEDFLTVIAQLLGKIGFESHPCDTHPPAREVILPAGWRDLPIIKAAILWPIRSDGDESAESATEPRHG